MADKGTIRVHNSVRIDAKNPIPVDFGGSAFTYLGSHKYIPFFAPDDNLFRTLLEARLLSPTHSACIGDKTFYSIGEGLQLKEQGEGDKKKVLPDELSGKINGKRQTLNGVIKDIFECLYQDGNKFIEITRSEIGGKRYVHVYVHNNMDNRLELNEEGDPMNVIRTKQFRKNGIITKLENPIIIPLWTDNSAMKETVWVKDPKNKKVERTILHIKNPICGLEEGYGLPTFYAGLMQVVLEHKTARFNLDNFDNNMFLAGMLFLKGNVGVEEGKELTKAIRKMYTGEGRANRILPVSSEQGLEDAKFEPFNETHDGHFLDLDKKTEEKIIGSHHWSRALMDLRSDGSLGKGGDYLRNLFIAKYKTVIKPVQDMVLEDFLEPFFQIMNEHLKTKFNVQDFFIKPVIPIQFEGDLNINSLLTVDEGRESIGRKGLGGEKGGMLVSEVSAKKVQNTEAT